MTGEEMIALSKKHTLFEWSAQSKVDPLPVARAKGIYFWTPEARSIGLFGLVELVRNRKTRQPMAPFNGTSGEMAALGKFFRQEGLYTLVRWNTFFTNPPLGITEPELREAVTIVDRGWRSRTGR